jgi:peptidyl-prolyl cis-trans isomerase D
VQPASTDAQRLASAQQQIASVNAQAEAESYLDAVRTRSKVKMYGSLDNPQSGE